MRDGRVSEQLQENYNPAGDSKFDASAKWSAARNDSQRRKRSEGPELDKGFGARA